MHLYSLYSVRIADKAYKITESLAPCSVHINNTGAHCLSSMSTEFVVLFATCLLAGLVSGYEITRVTGPVTMGESPYWDNNTNTVIFVDVIGGQVLRYDPAHPEEVKSVNLSSFGGKVTPAVPVKEGSEMLVGVGLTVHLIQIEWGEPGEPAVLKRSIPMSQVEPHLKGNRFNDGKADRRGRLWIGTMDDSQTSRRRRRSPNQVNQGELFRFDLQHHVTKGYQVETTCVVKDNLQIPNGMAWTADDKIYYLADSTFAAIFQFDFDIEKGTLSNKKEVFKFADHNVPGAPDGMTLDVDGNLWIACVHGGRVIQVDPRSGKLLKTIVLSVSNPSAAEWGGPNRDVLYVTTARYKLSQKQEQQEPDAGCMFAITGLGTRGIQNVPYPVVSR